MNFDAFRNITISQKNQLLDHCRSAERNVRIEPFNSIASARAALDLLCIQLLISKNMYTGQTLCRMISDCVQEQLFISREDAHFVRLAGNRFVHTKDAEQEQEIPLDKCLHTVSTNNVELAKNVAHKLYKIMSEAFDISCEFDDEKIPFGEYEILHKVPKDPREIIVGDYNYFVENSAHDCYYVQIIPNNALDAGEKAFVNRNRSAVSIIREDREPRAFLKNAQMLFGHCDDAEMEYVAYHAYPDSYILAELVMGDRSTLSPWQSLQVCRDLLDTLIEMMDLGQGLHHRNISPSCVMLTPGNAKLRGSLINFQTAKIENNEISIRRYLRGIYDSNMFVHPNIRNADLCQFDGYWDKADAYSVAAILIFCVKPEAVQSEIDVTDIDEYFSEEMVDFLDRIFRNSLGAGCTLTEFREVIENEANQYRQ